MAAQKPKMEIADRKTIRQWYRLIDDGVPQDKALERLKNEATLPTAPREYRTAYTFFSDMGILETSGLTIAECLVLRIYTDGELNFYRIFNEDCRNRKWEKYVVFTSLLHSGLCKLRRKHDENTLEVTRCVNCDTKIKTDIKVLCMPCFTSAASEISTAKRFGSNTITYRTSTCGPISDFSIYCDEKELLITPFQCFTVEENSSQPAFKTSIEMTSPFLASPLIRGSLLGAVVGNCIGAPYEFEDPKPVAELLQNLHGLESDENWRGLCRYTVDISMTLDLADSLTRVESLDIDDLRKCFVKTCIDDPDRGYSESIIRVLQELHGQKKGDDHFAPAKRLFNGQGSKGNGGAMRIAPLAIYYFFERGNQFSTYVKDVTALTHNHIIAIHGAILQATAVQYALTSSIYGGRSDAFGHYYVEELIKRMKSIDFLARPFCTKLEKIKEYLQIAPSEETVRIELGTKATADESVPTAIYCFLRGLKPIPGIPSDRSEFERTIIYAISLGGDTDTIASMAGAIAGAYYGQDAVTQRWRDLCETKAIDGAKRYANKMIAQLFWDGIE